MLQSLISHLVAVLSSALRLPSKAEDVLPSAIPEVPPMMKPGPIPMPPPQFGGVQRQITHIVVHSAATPPTMDIGAEQIRQWHVNRGWSTIGYHFVIRRSGKLELGRELAIAGAHVAGQNARSIGICLVGGADAIKRPENNFTPAQMFQLADLLRQLLKRWPTAVVCGHRDMPGTATACPSFDVQRWWAEVTSD